MWDSKNIIETIQLCETGLTGDNVLYEKAET